MIDQSSTIFPKEFICPNCNSSIATWINDSSGKCGQCGEILKIVFIHDSLIKYCMSLGVNAVNIIPATKISVEQHFSELCKNGKCPSYGMSPSCPPYVMSTNQFQAILSKYDFGLIFKFEIPTNVLFGNERHEVVHLLHETASEIKKFALNNGYSRSMAIAAGSCKQIFCKEHKTCPIITGFGKCRYPETACPSMSGLGINFHKITQLHGWANTKAKENEEPSTNMAGIVLLRLP